MLYLAVQAPGLGEDRARLRRWLRAALTAAAVLELGWNSQVILSGLEGQFHSDSYAAYRSYYTSNAQLVRAAEEDAAGEFYRLGAAEDRGHNSPLSFGYPGITHYSSLYNDGVNRALKELGFAQSWMWCAWYGSTPATDALFGIRYVISAEEMPGYQPLAQAGGLTLWKNPDALPLAFLQPEKTGGGLGSTPFARQNSLYSSLLGENTALFTPVEAAVFTGDWDTTLVFTGTGRPVYADLSASGLEEVWVNGQRALALGSSEAASVHCLGTPEAGEVWTVSVRRSGAWNEPEPLWELDQQALHAAAARLDNTQIAEVGKNGLVRLTAQSQEGQVLATTIPAEGGWSAYVDGQRVDTSTWLGAFLAVFLPAGEHTVELRYTAPGLLPGLALGAAALALLCLRRFTLRGRERPDGAPEGEGCRRSAE